MRPRRAAAVLVERRHEGGGVRGRFREVFDVFVHRVRVRRVFEERRQRHEAAGLETEDVFVLPRRDDVAAPEAPVQISPKRATIRIVAGGAAPGDIG